MIDIDLPLNKISLTDRERDILRLLTNGLTDGEIAETLVLTTGTVKWYNRQIYNKLSVRNRIEAITRAQRLGLLSAAPHPEPPVRQGPPVLHLPAQVTSFVGRGHELAELKAALGASRLVTLTGPPGTGKTRLALEVASRMLEYYRDGVYFVSLASIQDASLVADMIARSLDVKESGSDSILAVLKATLRDKRVLLVLDNFEHLLAAAPLVSDLLAAAPRLTVLVTSREILRLYGEQEFSVPPLQLPDLRQEVTVTALLTYEAIELFIQRAHAVQPAFALGDDNAAAVGTICVHLDGLPLAIELAAARLKFYAPQTLLLRLGSRLEALGEGARDLPARQRTLRATLAWSYDLLTAEEKSLFARLGVFAGGFSAADAEAVCGDGLGLDVAEGLESLLNKSLLRQTPGETGDPRFMMLETMREYALEKLVQGGEIEQIRDQHAVYFLRLAELADQELNTPRWAEWLTRLAIQHDNLRTALKRRLARDDSIDSDGSIDSDDSDENGQTNLRFVGYLAGFWRTRGYYSEGRGWLGEALERKDARASTRERAHALRSLGTFAYEQCDYLSARGVYMEALAIDKQIGDLSGIAWSLAQLGDTHIATGEYAVAEQMLLQAVEIFRQLGKKGGLAHALVVLAWCPVRSRGDYSQAVAWIEEALAIFHQRGDRVEVALAYSGLGEIAIRRGELERGIQLLEQSLTLRQELGQKWGIAASLGSLGWASQRQGNFERATALLGESLLIRKEIGDPGGIAWCLERLAEIAHAQKEDGRAARIFGAAAVLRTSINSPIDPIDQPEHDRILSRIRKRLGEAVYEAVWAEGQAMPLERLMEYQSFSAVSSS